MNKEKAKRRQMVAEAQSRARAGNRQQREYDQAQKEAKVRQVLASKPVRRTSLQVRFANFTFPAGSAARFGSLDKVFRRAPKLDDVRYEEGFKTIVSQETWENPLEDWRPKGKAPDTQFRSLIRHLLVKYPIAPLFFSAFFPVAHPWKIRLFLYLAKGGSLYKATQGINPLLPIPLTKKMCHEVTQTSIEYTIVQAARRAQVLAFGGDMRIVRAVCALNVAANAGVREELVAQVLQWICQQPMLDTAHLGPIFDWVNYRFTDDPNFSMKGRTGGSVLRDVEVWHTMLAKTKADNSAVFKPSGFNEEVFERKKNLEGTHYMEQWAFKEILTVKELHEEGKKLHHCVYSYARSIQSGDTAIWSLRVDGSRTLTLEVSVRSCRIVQIRGFGNRKATPLEMTYIQRWAANNRLSIAEYA